MYKEEIYKDKQLVFGVFDVNSVLIKDENSL